MGGSEGGWRRSGSVGEAGEGLEEVSGGVEEGSDEDWRRSGGVGETGEGLEEGWEPRRV